MVLRPGQAMVETLIAVLFVTSLFLVSFHLVEMYRSRILLDHASERAARAKAVGLNDFMCEKSARAAIIPVAGERTWPREDIDEVPRVPIYLASEHGARARAILDYERWCSTKVSVESEMGLAPIVKASVKMNGDGFTMSGEGAVESHFPLYMEDNGF